MTTIRRMVRLSFLGTTLLFVAAGTARASLDDAAEAAADWLESSGQQNSDGSWGDEEEVRFLYTSAVVDALRAYGRRGSAYFRGVAWLENHAMESVDARARRIASLEPNGDDTSADLGYLLENGIPSSGWGLSGAYAPSPLDSALALLAVGEVWATNPSNLTLLPIALDALEYLSQSHVQQPDGGWRTSSGSAVDPPSSASDPIVTALVLRAYAAIHSQYPELGLEFLSSRMRGLDFLEAQTTSLDALNRAHVALALLSWSPTSASAQALLDTFDTSPPQASWMSDSYVTAVVLHALAVKLGTDAPELQESVSVGDIRLKGAINTSLGRNRLDALTRGDLRSLSSVDLSYQGIEDLSGLEEAINLTAIDLTGNTGIQDTTLLYSLASVPGFVPPTPFCDVGQNYAVDASDGLLAARAAAGKVSLSPTQVFVGDVAPPIGADSTAQLNAADAVVVIRAAAGTTAACGP